MCPQKAFPSNYNNRVFIKGHYAFLSVPYITTSILRIKDKRVVITHNDTKMLLFLNQDSNPNDYRDITHKNIFYIIIEIFI